MSFFTSLGILVLSMLIQLFLQLSPAVFAIFYHSALANFSRKRADDLSLGFILGQELCTAFLFLAAFIVTAFTFQDPNPLSRVLPWLLAGICFAEAIVTCFFYFRRGPGTRLFISRRAATSLTLHAKKAKTRSDAIALGFVTSLLETPFTLPLYLAMSLAIHSFTSISSSLLIGVDLLLVTIPLFIIRCFYTSGHHLAAIQRYRARHRLLTRLILSLNFLAIAVLLIINRI